MNWRASITRIIIWSSPFQTDIPARKSESIKPSPSSKPKPNCLMLFSTLCVIPAATYKLKLNHGDLKATQGDTGHAEIDMLTKVYAHILDADRKITAQRFEEAFYQPLNSPEQKDNSSSSPDIAALITQIQQYPELGKILSDVLAKQASTDENTENGNGNLSDSE